MQIADILTPDRMLCYVRATSKKRVLEYFSQLLTTEVSPLTDREIFDGLLAREHLGSTGLTNGVGVPHARVANCQVILAAFLQIEQGIDFEAQDRKPVDLFFALLVPEEATSEHLEVLALLAEMFSDGDFREKLRTTPKCADKFILLTTWQSRHTDV